MMYLPRICEHCINPSCVASCPSGAMYKREEDGIVLVDQEACRSWRFCVSGCPYKKVYFNWNTGKAEKCNFCYPRIEAGLPTVCSETCVGRLRHLGIVLIDTDRVEAAASVADEQDLLEAQLDLLLDPEDPEVREQALPRRDRRRLDRGGAPLARLRDVQALADRAAAASRVPHAADGLVRAAALAGREHGRADRRRRARPRATSSRRSTRCGSRSSTWRSFMAAGDPEPVRRSLRATRGDAPLHAGRERRRRGRHGDRPRGRDGRRPRSRRCSGWSRSATTTTAT